jgi:hypothetical protein
MLIRKRKSIRRSFVIESCKPDLNATSTLINLMA